MQIKPYKFDCTSKSKMYKSNVCTSSTIGIFKGFLLRALNVCLQKCFDEEITFLIDIFTNNRQLRVKEKKKCKKSITKSISRKAFKANYQKSEQNFNLIKLSWIPKLGSKLRRGLREFNIKTVFTSNKNLKFLLCQKILNLAPNSYPGVYKLTCSSNAVYYGELKKNVLSRNGIVLTKNGNFIGN